MFSSFTNLKNIKISFKLQWTHDVYENTINIYPRCYKLTSMSSWVFLVISPFFSPPVTNRADRRIAVFDWNRPFTFTLSVVLRAPDAVVLPSNFRRKIFLADPMKHYCHHSALLRCKTSASCKTGLTRLAYSADIWPFYPSYTRQLYEKLYKYTIYLVVCGSYQSIFDYIDDLASDG